MMDFKSRASISRDVVIQSILEHVDGDSTILDGREFHSSTKLCEKKKNILSCRVSRTAYILDLLFYIDLPRNWEGIPRIFSHCSW